MNLTFWLTTGTAGPQNTLTSLAHYGFTENAPATVMGADKRNVEHMTPDQKKPPNGGFGLRSYRLSRDDIFVFKLANNIHGFQGLIIDPRRRQG